MDINQFKNLVYVKLKEANLYSESAFNLLILTALHESYGLQYIRQKRGPALGFFQMEPATEKDIWENYLAFKKDLSELVTNITGRSGPGDWLEYDLCYQIIMARIHYLRVKEPIPNQDDIEEMARYWKKYYNTEAGRGTEEKFINTVSKSFLY